MTHLLKFGTYLFKVQIHLFKFGHVVHVSKFPGKVTKLESTVFRRAAEGRRRIFWTHYFKIFWIRLFNRTLDLKPELRDHSGDSKSSLKAESPDHSSDSKSRVPESLQ